MEHRKRSEFVANCQYGGSKNRFLDRNRTFSRIDFKRNVSNGKITKTSKKPVISEKKITLKIPIEEEMRYGEQNRITYKSIEMCTDFEKGFTKPELFNQIFDFYEENGINYTYEKYERNEIHYYEKVIKTENIKNVTIESIDLDDVKETGEYVLKVSFTEPH